MKQDTHFLSDKQVARRYNVKRTSIWRWVQKNGFPKPLKLSPGCTRWELESIVEWERKKKDKKEH